LDPKTIKTVKIYKTTTTGKPAKAGGQTEEELLWLSFWLRQGTGFNWLENQISLSRTYTKVAGY